MNTPPWSLLRPQSRDTNAISLPRGGLLGLPTKAEAQARLVLIEVFFAQVPIKAANSILRAIDSAISCHGDTALPHLRRFAKRVLLPSSLRQLIESRDHGRTLNQPELGLPVHSPGADILLTNHDIVLEDVAASSIGNGESTLYFLICPTTRLSLEEVEYTFSMSLAWKKSELLPIVHTTSVPAHGPTSEEQAKQWSQDYWPTLYRKHNPHGPHPSIVSRAEDIIRPFVATWISMARAVAQEAAGASIGECIGSVITDPKAKDGPDVIVAAGDARWKEGIRNYDQDSGNVMAHAVLRAIGMVARKRKEVLGPSASDLSEANVFIDHPITPQEHELYSRHPLKPGGYLCAGLEIYLTHEPCIMCSMAILHSRFDKVIFAKRMPRTGSLTAESCGGLGYGLFWLPELNWKLLAWQWLDEVEQEDPLCLSSTHA